MSETILFPRFDCFSLGIYFRMFVCTNREHSQWMRQYCFLTWLLQFRHIFPLKVSSSSLFAQIAITVSKHTLTVGDGKRYHNSRVVWAVTGLRPVSVCLHKSCLQWASTPWSLEMENVSTTRVWYGCYFVFVLSVFVFIFSRESECYHKSWHFVVRSWLLNIVFAKSVSYKWSQ